MKHQTIQTLDGRPAPSARTAIPGNVLTYFERELQGTTVNVTVVPPTGIEPVSSA